MVESYGQWTFKLPDDLVVFLRSGHQLEYDAAECEPGQVTLQDIASLGLVDVSSVL